MNITKQHAIVPTGRMGLKIALSLKHFQSIHAEVPAWKLKHYIYIYLFKKKEHDYL